MQENLMKKITYPESVIHSLKNLTLEEDVWNNTYII